MTRRFIMAAVAALFAAALVSGCGEEQFDAAGLVDGLNEAGAGLELGEPLSSTEGTAVTAVGFAEAGNGAAGDAERADGAIVILGDSEAAEAEFTRCENAVDFVCFRAANAVLRFAGISPEEQTRLTAAFSSLETD